MDWRRILRLASVLIASQMRAGRSTSKPGDFFGRPAAVVVADAIVFLVIFGLGSLVVAGLASADPALFDSVALEVIAFLPLLAIGSVLVAGLMFELSNSSRFAASDAANWLPITPLEYVTASALAATFVYSLTASFALGIGAAITLHYGHIGLFLASAVLCIAGLLEGSVIIEILRSSTQRISTVVARRTGRATLVLRLLLFLAVILAIQITFNPVLLLGILSQLNSLGWVAFAVPVLWPSRTVLALDGPDYLTAAVLALGEAALIGLLIGLAAYLRVRFWAPAAPELSLAPHAYAESHPVLSAIGLAPAESALVAKDLRGLTRRRELLPILVVPLVLAIVSLATSFRTGNEAPFAPAFLAAWVAGFFSLLLATTSFAQERRAVQNLYAFPLDARAIFRAKVAGVLLPSLVFALVFWAIITFTFGFVLRTAVGLLAVMVLTTFIGGFLGLAFAARYSDFQERPRPQFLRPAAMIAAVFLGVALIFGVAIPALFWVFGVAPASEWWPFAVAMGIGIAVVAVTFRLAQTGTRRLLQALPL